MIKDKLTQILGYITPNPDARSEDYYEELFTMVRDLRCDKCEHWGSPDVVTGKGTCETVPSDDYIWTAPDFFCALWEEKK